MRDIASVVTASLRERELQSVPVSVLTAGDSELCWKTHPTTMRRFRAAAGSVSVIRMTSLAPAPPTASMARLNLSSRWRKRFTWCIDPSGEAAKNSRSETSHAIHEMGCGK